MVRVILAGILAVGASVAANATPVFSESFDSVAGLGALGWLQTNNSSPAGETGWFQGNSGVFASQSGSADSYIAANFLNAGFGGNVDNWLITPLISFDTGDFISFFTRTNGGFPGDSLDLLYSTGSTNLGDFSSLLSISAADYPTDWTQFTYTYLGAASDLRLAFRYHVTDTSTNGDYIGIDSFSVAVPEPGTLALLGAGLLFLVPLISRRRLKSSSGLGSASGRGLGSGARLAGVVGLAAAASALSTPTVAAKAVASAPTPAATSTNVTDPATLPKFEHVVVVNLAAQQPAGVKAQAPSAQTGMRAYIDPVTKQLRAPTGEELAQEAAASKAALTRNLRGAAASSETGVVSSSATLRRSDGSVSVKLGDEFMSYEVARVAQDGSVTHECVGEQPNEKAALKAALASHGERSHEK